MGTVKLPSNWEIRHRNAIRDGDNGIPRWAKEFYHVLDSRTDHIASGSTPGEAKKNAQRVSDRPFDTPARVDMGSSYAREFDDKGRPRRKSGGRTLK